MKKTISALLVLLLVLTGCSGGAPKATTEDNVKILNAATRESSDTKSMSMDMDMKMKYSDSKNAAGKDIAFKYTIGFKDLEDAENGQLVFEMSEDTQSIAVNLYKVGPVMYMESNGVKIKLTGEEMAQMGGANFDNIKSQSSMVTSFPEFKASDVDYEKKDGIDIFTVKVDNKETEATISDYVTSGFKDMLGSMSPADIKADLKLESLVYKVKDGHLSGVTIQAKITEGTSKESMTFSVDVNITGVNETTKLVFPSFDDYKSISELSGMQ